MNSKKCKSVAELKMRTIAGNWNRIDSKDNYVSKTIDVHGCQRFNIIAIDVEPKNQAFKVLVKTEDEGLGKRGWVDPFSLNGEDDEGDNIILGMLDRFKMYSKIILMGNKDQAMIDRLQNGIKAAEILTCKIEYKNHLDRADIKSEPKAEYYSPSKPSKEFMQQFGGKLRTDHLDPQKKQRFLDFLDNEAHTFISKLERVAFQNNLLTKQQVHAFLSQTVKRLQKMYHERVVEPATQ